MWLINEPVKVAFVDGELLMEAHPPVDEEGQNTSEPNLDLLSQKLDQALGSTTAAIHWDFAKEALQAANGIPTVVGLQADLDPAPSADPAAPAATAPPAAAAVSLRHIDCGGDFGVEKAEPNAAPATPPAAEAPAPAASRTAAASPPQP